LTAQLEYNAGNAYGIGKSEYMLEPMTDAQWNSPEKSKQSFWQGQYFVRLDDADSNFAYVSLYKGDVRISSTKVDIGKQSADLFIPGFYCRAGVKVAYDGFVAKQDSARIEISDERGTDTFDVYRGSYFLEGNCRVNDLRIDDNGGTGTIDASCYGKRITLSLQSKDNAPVKKDPKTGQVITESIKNEPITDIDTAEYLNNTLKYYEQVANDYPAEKMTASQDTYGEQGLIKAIKIARDSKQFNTEVRLMQKYVQIYPTNNFKVEEYNTAISEMLKINFVDAVKVINVGSRARTVSLVQFTKILDSQSKARAVFVVDGTQTTVRLGESLGLSNGKSFRINYIDFYLEKVRVRL
jgi:hypothetical protein